MPTIMGRQSVLHRFAISSRSINVNLRHLMPCPMTYYTRFLTPSALGICLPHFQGTRWSVLTWPCSPPPHVYNSPDSKIAAEWNPPQATCPTFLPIKAYR